MQNRAIGQITIELVNQNRDNKPKLLLRTSLSPISSRQLSGIADRAVVVKIEAGDLSSCRKNLLCV